MATWLGEPGPDDDTSVTLTLTGRPNVVQLICDGDTQLVMMVFTIAHRDRPGKQGILISGQLHIRTPSEKKRRGKLTYATRKRAVVQALQHLDKHAETATRGASQPTAPVIVLTGDVNLTKWCCDPLVQEYSGPQSVETQWQVKTSNAQLSGDVLFHQGR